VILLSGLEAFLRAPPDLVTAAMLSMRAEGPGSRLNHKARATFATY
jgi:hypothetical protein